MMDSRLSSQCFILAFLALTAWVTVTKAWTVNVESQIAVNLNQSLPGTHGNTNGTDVMEIQSSKGNTNGTDGNMNRIVGGEVVVPHSLPWQVAMIRKNSGDGYLTLKCGGIIICPRFVLSAGHCTDNPPNRFQIVTGAHNLKAIEPSISRHDIVKYHNHPKYKNLGLYSEYDFTIMELSQPINFKTEARPVFLPTSQKFGPDTKFLVSGWGLLSDGGDLPDQLQSVTIPFLSKKDCKAAYKDPKINSNGEPEQYAIEEYMICAGFKEGKVDACAGDSGGPMVWLNPKTENVEVIGAVSYGFSCAQANSPGVYSDISKVLDWVQKTTGGCNEKTCAAGECMTKKIIHRNTLQRFTHLTEPKLL